MYLSFKRILDFTISLCCLILLIPVFLPVMMLLKFTGEGEIFYFQERIGRGKKSFHIWKFATMLKDSLNMGSKTITLKGDPRITPFGGVLRKTKINELPQIINVLKGDMSIVGPRPLIPPSFKKYSQEVQDRISQTRPGITGIGSVIFRNESAIVEHGSKALSIHPLQFYKDFCYPYKGAVEMWYQDHYGFITDLLIIFLTAWQIFFPNSDLVFRVFSSLPVRPKELTLEHWKTYITKNVTS